MLCDILVKLGSTPQRYFLLNRSPADKTLGCLPQTRVSTQMSRQTIGKDLLKGQLSLYCLHTGSSLLPPLLFSFNLQEDILGTSSAIPHIKVEQVEPEEMFYIINNRRPYAIVHRTLAPFGDLRNWAGHGDLYLRSPVVDRLGL